MADDRAPDAFETALLEPGGDDPAAAAVLPRVLGDDDADLYRRIFEVQEDGDWKAADRLIARLGDRLLMGHVMAQRYLHPTKYRSRYKELKDWMALYADHPDARRIYKLALRRRPENWKAPQPPLSRRPAAAVVETAKRSPAIPATKRRSKKERLQVRDYQRKIRWYLRKGWTLAVKKLLREDKVKHLFTAFEYDSAQAGLGAGYFAAGRDEWALQWAGRAAGRSGTFIPEAHWTAGLAAWRLGRFADAGRHFEAVASEANSPWLISAAAFWAARSHLVDRRPARVTPLLAKAAVHPRTFYGLLARRLLALPTRFDWATPELATAALEALEAVPEGRRALALIRVGRDRRAERELRAVAASGGPVLIRGVLALASRTDMPALAVRLNERLFPDGGGYDGAAYPVPGWRPDGGFRIDRALIYALVRQESRFNPKAKSYAGASGLMQLMPRTASFVARDKRLRTTMRRTLFEPLVNLGLGQKYVSMLLANDKIRGDLFLLAAAWNGGPGNLNKWRREIKHMDDPLFFIESLPTRETRIFIERVLTNLWIYRNRLGQPAPSLDAIAAGDWPTYIPLDREPMMVVQDEQDRR